MPQLLLRGRRLLLFLRLLFHLPLRRVRYTAIVRSIDSLLGRLARHVGSRRPPVSLLLDLLLLVLVCDIVPPQTRAFGIPHDRFVTL